MEESGNINWKKYLIVLIITGVIFGTALYVSDYFGQKKIQDIKNIQDKLAIDILSSETEFSLLENASCKDIASTTALSAELGSLEDKLSYTEQQRGTNDPDVLSLKQNYSLLEIKDYLLMKQISVKCKTTPVSIIYFYSNKDGECPDCQKEGYVLTQLRTDYPSLRVYSFDYDLDLSALKTLLSINKIKGNLPALVIGDDTFYSFQSLDTLEKLHDLKPLVQAKVATSTTNAKK
jgi:hypothetical protein